MIEEIGSIVGKGPLKDLPYPHGNNIAFLDYPGATPPPDLYGMPFWTILPVKVTIDKATLDNSWVKIIKSSDTRLVNLWCEYPRFKSDAAPIPTSGKKFKVSLTVSGIIEEITT